MRSLIASGRPVSRLLWMLPPVVFLTALWLSALPRSSAAQRHTPRRVALLVGISDYEHGAKQQTPPTPGIPHEEEGGDGFGNLATGPDLDNMEAVLKRYGFTVRRIADADATQENIIREFNECLIKGAGPGDSVVFYFTGHGHQIEDNNNEAAETDGMDECLVTWTPPAAQKLLRKDRREIAFMRDDRISELLKTLTTRMTANNTVKGSVTVILDSCHSGDATKGNLIPKGREWNEALDGPHPRARPTPDGDISKSGQAGSSGGGWLDGGAIPGIVFLAGAESDRRSFMMDGSGKGSVMTYFLCAALSQALPKPPSGASNSSGPLSSVYSYRTIYERVSALTNSRNIEQHPQLLPLSEAPLFGDWHDRAPGTPTVPYLVVTGTLSGQVNLDAGSIAGVTKGSRYALYKQGTDPSATDNRPVAEIEIDRVFDFSARARVLSPGIPIGQSSVGMRAVETSHQYRDITLRVKVLTDENTPRGFADPANTGVRKVLKEVSFVEVTDGNDWDVLIRLGKDRLGKDSQYNYSRSPSDRMGESLGWQLPSEELKRQLARDWRWTRLYRLESPSRSLSGQLELDAIAEVPFDPESGLPQLDEKDLRPRHSLESKMVRLRPGDDTSVILRNRAAQRLFVYVVYLGSDGEIRLLVTDNNPQGGVDVRNDGKPYVVATIRNIDPPAAGVEEERNLIKVIATPRRVNLVGLNSPKGSREVGKETGDPYMDLVLGIKDDARAKTDLSIPDYAQWQVANLEFRIVR